MRFNANRLSVLAGIGSPSSSGRLSEGSHHEIDELEEIDEMEDVDELDDMEEDDDVGDDEEVMLELGNRRKRDEYGDVDEMGHQLAENQVFEIDERMLRNELLKMRSQKKQSLAERKIRKAVRSQIKEVMLDRILNEDDDDLNYGSGWVYGKNKPRRSKKGYVARGGFSIGFE